VAHYLPYCVFGALAKSGSPRLMAASSHPIWSQRFAGTWKGNQSFLAAQMISGGLGARSTKDGISALSYPGNVSNVPVEVLESDAPLLVEEKSIRPDSGGPGRFRGGCGQDFRIRILPFESENREPRMFCANRADRLLTPALGLEGGLPGEIGRVLRNDGETVHGKKAVSLAPGDTVLWSLPGGGGYFDPLTRDPQAVALDVRDRFVTVDHAREAYGVVIDPTTLEVDAVATEALRMSISSERIGAPA
jgi:N-methylhydantoinase B